ncbi:hypothetical protein, partial [Comamonas jiangduensis]|uniref:hypothetical protein n=1 Tax=Comamonas jiangduensis TaxID=1194168 RepID=UPI00289A39FE
METIIGKASKIYQYGLIGFSPPLSPHTPEMGSTQIFWNSYSPNRLQQQRPTGLVGWWVGGLVGWWVGGLVG